MLNELYARMNALVAGARDEEGQGLVEYALILVFVSIVSIGVLTILGVDVSDIFTTVETALDGQAGG
jgi:pilus assembly protein Flp/PilA